MDISGLAVLQYKDFVGVLAAAKDSDSPCHFTIQGEKGWIQVPGKPNEVERLRYCINKQVEEYNPPADKNRLVQEFRNFSRAAAENDRAFMERELEITLAVMRTIERARLGAGIHFPTDL